MNEAHPQLFVSGVFQGLEPVVETTPVFEIHTDSNGVLGSRFYGAQRYSKSEDCIRDNERMWSAVMGKEVRKMIERWNNLLKEAGSSARIRELRPGWLGPNVCFEGNLGDFSLLPEGTELHFTRGPVFVVAEENAPCMSAATFIASKQGEQDVLAAKFVQAALHLRGLVGSVKQGGLIRVGDLCEVVYPNPSS
jgi:hypothetical protein